MVKVVLEEWKFEKICLYMLAGHVFLYLTGIGQNLGEGVSAPSELSVVPQLWSGSH